jgi:beta-1,2-mannobiose phosphorylase / 1,2-beta-oligomannan phosphorylase
VLYHGVNDAIQYQLGVLLLDLNDPTKIIYRSDKPIFGPKEKIELSGMVDIIPGVVKLIEEGKEEELKQRLQEAERGGFMPQVTFVTAAVVVDGIVHLYYGASDVFICTATASLRDIMATIP